MVARVILATRLGIASNTTGLIAIPSGAGWEMLVRRGRARISVRNVFIVGLYRLNRLVGL